MQKNIRCAIAASVLAISALATPASAIELNASGNIADSAAQALGQTGVGGGSIGPGIAAAFATDGHIAVAESGVQTLTDGGDTQTLTASSALTEGYSTYTGGSFGFAAQGGFAGGIHAAGAEALGLGGSFEAVP